MTAAGGAVGAVMLTLIAAPWAAPFGVLGDVVPIGNHHAPAWTFAVWIVVISTVVAYLTGAAAVQRLSAAVGGAVAYVEVVAATLFALGPARRAAQRARAARRHDRAGRRVRGAVQRQPLEEAGRAPLRSNRHTSGADRSSAPARSQVHSRRPTPGRERPAAAPGPGRAATRSAGPRPRPGCTGRRGTRSAVPDRVLGSAGVAGHHRQPARRGLQEHDPECLRLQPEPPGPARHREHVTELDVRRYGCPRHRPGEPHRLADPERPSQCAEPVAIRSAPDQQQYGVRYRGAHPRPGTDQCVLTARYQPGHTGLQCSGRATRQPAPPHPDGSATRPHRERAAASSCPQAAPARSAAATGPDDHVTVPRPRRSGAAPTGCRHRRPPGLVPCVIATTRSAPATRSAGPINPSGAAAPNSTRSQRWSRSIQTACRVARGVGSSIDARSRTTGTAT